MTAIRPTLRESDEGLQSGKQASLFIIIAACVAAVTLSLMTFFAIGAQERGHHADHAPPSAMVAER